MSDISITIGSTTKLFDLAQEDNKKLFSAREESIIPIRSLSNVPSYGDLPPEKILAFAQNNWRGGLGQVNKLRILDKYADGASIDSEVPNQLVLGPVINTIGAIADTIIGFKFFNDREYAFSSAKVYKLNTAGDTWTAVLEPTPKTSPLTLRPNAAGDETNIPTQTPASTVHWDKVDEVVADEDTTTVSNDTGTYQRDLYAIPNHDPEYFGVIASVKVYVRFRHEGAASAFAKPVIKIGGTVYEGDVYENTTTAYYNHSHTWATNPATSVAWTWSDIDSLQIGVSLKRGGSGNSICTQVYVEVAFTPVNDTIECMEVYDDYIFAGLTNGRYYYSSTGESSSWTQCTLSNAVAHLFGIVPPFSGTKDLFVLAKKPNELRTTISPLNAGTGWIDPPYYISDTTSDITSISVLNGLILVGKEDGWYLLPSDGRPQALLPEFRVRRSASNLKHAISFQSSLYASLSDDIVELTSSYSMDYMGPLELNPSLGTTGTLKGLAASDKNIYVVFLIGTNYTIYSGKERYDGDYGLRWEWMPLVNLSTNACSAIKVMQRTGANPKLWFAYGTNVANIILVKNSNYRYCAQGYAITSYFDVEYDIWAKIFYQLWTIASGLDTTHQYIIVYYRKDTDTSWTSLATITTNGIKSVDFTAISCKKIQLKIELNSDDSTKTPLLSQFILRGILQPELTRTLDFTVMLEQSASRKVSTDLSFLEGGRTATAPITLKDLRFGTTKYIAFLPNSPMEIETLDEITKQPSYQARILAQQLNWTAP